MKPKESAETPADRKPEPVPTWDNERSLFARGLSLVAGVDEAGRGAWAGPLVAASVIFHSKSLIDAPTEDDSLSTELLALRDSKLLSECMREELSSVIHRRALAVGIGIVSAALVDVIGLGAANRLAMARAVRDLGIWPEYLLIDAFRLPSLPIPQLPIIKGDATCMSIAAASVIAKVTRDRIMQNQDTLCPGYDFSRHKGYGTRHHVRMLERLGVSPQHRRSYAPIKLLLAGQEQGA
ncbi:MAG TPA: ribonuclease HII [Chloroflexia bacterium]|nr:ribonuclease HII [Chloroflexia bacterium]